MLFKTSHSTFPFNQLILSGILRVSTNTYDTEENFRIRINFMLNEKNIDDFTKRLKARLFLLY